MPRALMARMNAGSAVVAFGVLVLVMLWLGLAWDLGRERDRALAQADADTANLARAFHEHIHRTIAGLDQTLLYVKSEFETERATFDLRKMVERSAILNNTSVQLAVIGADGQLVDSSVPGFAPVDLSDRDHFRIHRTYADAGLFISRPVLGRASGKWSIQLTRRLNNHDGSFAGVVVLSLDPRYLSDFYGSFDVGTKGAILLVGRDGVIRAASDASVGREVSPILADAMFTAGSGSQQMLGPLDQERRIASFRALDDMPLAVWVGRSQAEVLAGNAQAMRGTVLVGVVISVVLGAALLMVYTLVRRQEAIAHDLSVKKAELLASRERLRRYVQDLERIAEVAAHDLQEPLRRVVSYAQLLANHAETALDAEGRDYVAHVVSGAQRMRKLVQDLEAFVAVDHLPVADRPVSATLGASAAAEILAEDVRTSGATLLIDALPEVAADEKSLTEIFTQLVGNAIRYRSPERKPLVHVSAQREDEFVVFSVRDNGLGIDERHQPRLFEIFHRLHTVDGRSGSGIGLAMVRRIVERLGGRVWVESKAGSGSCFHFTLPLSVRTGSDQEVQAA